VGSLGTGNAAERASGCSSIQRPALWALDFSLQAFCGAVAFFCSILAASAAFYFEFLLTIAFCVAHVASTQNLVYGALRVSSEPRIGLK
jgi:hypothetical protein